MCPNGGITQFFTFTHVSLKASPQTLPSQQCSGGFTLKLHVLKLAAVIFTPKCFSLLIVWNRTCCRKIIEKTTHCYKNGQENNGNRTILNSMVWDYLKFLTQGFSFHSLLCGCPQIITTHVLILGSPALKKKKKKRKEKSMKYDGIFFKYSVIPILPYFPAPEMPLLDTTELKLE